MGGSNTRTISLQDVRCSLLAMWGKDDLRQKDLLASQLSKDLENKLASATKEAAKSVQENKLLKEKLIEVEKVIDESRQALQVGPPFRSWSRRLVTISSSFSPSEPCELDCQRVKKDHEAAMLSLKGTKVELERAKSSEAAALAKKHEVRFAPSKCPVPPARQDVRTFCSTFLTLLCTC